MPENMNSAERVPPAAPPTEPIAVPTTDQRPPDGLVCAAVDHMKSDEKWSPQWAVIAAFVMAVIWAAVVLWGLAMIVMGIAEIGKASTAQLGVLIGAVVAVLGLPVMLSAVAYLRTRRQGRFTFAAVTTVVLLGLFGFYALTV